MHPLSMHSDTAINLINQYILSTDSLPGTDTWADLEQAIASLRHAYVHREPVADYRRREIRDMISVANTTLQLAKAGGYGRIGTILNETTNVFEALEEILQCS